MIRALRVVFVLLTLSFVFACSKDSGSSTTDPKGNWLVTRLKVSSAEAIADGNGDMTIQVNDTSYKIKMIVQIDEENLTFISVYNGSSPNFATPKKYTMQGNIMTTTDNEGKQTRAAFIGGGDSFVVSSDDSSFYLSRLPDDKFEKFTGRKAKKAQAQPVEEKASVAPAPSTEAGSPNKIIKENIKDSESFNFSIKDSRKKILSSNSNSDKGDINCHLQNQTLSIKWETSDTKEWARIQMNQFPVSNSGTIDTAELTVKGSDVASGLVFSTSTGSNDSAVFMNSTQDSICALQLHYKDNFLTGQFKCDGLRGQTHAGAVNSGAAGNFACLVE